MKSNSISRYLTLLLFVTFFAVYHNAVSQELLRTEVPTYPSFPNAHMHHMVQDREGYMWYGTDAGLCRDNGYQVDVFCNTVADKNYWKSNHVMDITVGKDDKIWVVTRGGVYYLDKADYSIHEVVIPGLAVSQLSFISAMSDGTLWVFAGRDICRLTSSGKVIKMFRAGNKGDGKKFVNQIYEDTRHDQWLLECRGIMRRFDARRNEFVACDWPEGIEPYGGFVDDRRNHCFWISTWGYGIVKYETSDRGKNAKITFFPCTTEGNTLISNKGKIVNMVCGPDGHTLWCSAMDGFYAYTITPSGTLVEKDIDYLLPVGKKVFATIMCDRDDNIWVSSYSPHSFIISRNHTGIERHTMPQVLHDTGLESIVENIEPDEGDYMWIWHLRLNLMFENYRDGSLNILVKNGITGYGSSIMCKRQGGEGVWTGSGNKVCLLTHSAGTIGSVSCSDVFTLDDEVRCLYDDGRGSLWIGTLDGIWRYDISSRSLSNYFSGIGRVSRIRRTSDDSRLFFVIDKTGFGCGDIQTKKIVCRCDNSTEAFVALDVSPQNRVCAVTDVGSVYMFNEKKNSLEQATMIGLRSGGDILDAAYDAKGHLWILTSQCVIEYNQATHSSRIYDASDSSIGFDYFICLKRYGNRMIVGGAGGYCVLTPSESVTEHKTVHRNPVVTSWIIDGQIHFVGKGTRTIEIEHDDVNVAINFSTLDHLNANKVNYSYCLHRKGEKADRWVYLPQGHNTAYFEGLTKGRYVLDVKATDEVGNWGSPVECVEVYRVPAWWETWWAYLLEVLAVIICFALATRVYYNSKMQKMEIHKLVNLAKELKELQEQQLTTSLHEADEGTVKEQETVAEDGADAVKLSKAEEKFLIKAKEMVETNLSNEGYTTEMFASDMCMSRMSLYRKLQKLVGQTPTEFIRMIRLQAAAKMLKEGDLSVVQISEHVGFGSPSYFTKCFKDAFGVLPTQYR